MSGLLYREDMDEVRQRLKTWWEGGDLGRPALALTAPRSTPHEDIPALPEPAGWVTDYSTTDFAYRVNLSVRRCLHTDYLGEAVPNVAPDLAPNCLALYLGCRGVEMPGSVWCQPCMAAPEDARFVFDPTNFYWRFSTALAHEQLRLGENKFLVAFPDLIEGLDTLAAMRGTEALLVDLLERPDWVHACLRQITDRYFHAYDLWYDLLRDEVGGSVYWIWAPGRVSKFQCDFSAMISPALFAEFMLPVLREMCERVSYCLYHWDGPGAIAHHDHLLTLERLRVLQWTPGAGHEPAAHRRWWPLFHKTFEAGKKVYIGVETVDDLLALKREFGPAWKGFYLGLGVRSRKEGERVLALAEQS